MRLLLARGSEMRRDSRVALAIMAAAVALTTWLGCTDSPVRPIAQAASASHSPRTGPTVQPMNMHPLIDCHSDNEMYTWAYCDTIGFFDNVTPDYWAPDGIDIGDWGFDSWYDCSQDPGMCPQSGGGGTGAYGMQPVITDSSDAVDSGATFPTCPTKDARLQTWCQGDTLNNIRRTNLAGALNAMHALNDPICNKMAYAGDTMLMNDKAHFRVFEHRTNPAMDSIGALSRLNGANGPGGAESYMAWMTIDAKFTDVWISSAHTTTEWDKDSLKYWNADLQFILAHELDHLVYGAPDIGRAGLITLHTFECSGLTEP